jgi:hypothetical protein
MKPLPLSVRVAAGLAALAVEHTRKLPEHIVGLPMTVAGQAMRLSMRLQQHITDLAVKGDNALAAVRPPEDQPNWATFDEDVAEPGAPGPDQAPTEKIGYARIEVIGLDADHEAPPSLPGYPGMSLAQVRARLRHLSPDTLRELLDFERTAGPRPDFERMLGNRIRTVLERDERIARERQADHEAGH